MTEKPIYVSPPSTASLWQEYRILHDRIELATHFGVIIVPFEKIERVTQRAPLFAQLAGSEIWCREFRLGLKLGFADFMTHLEIDRSDGLLIRRILITPDNPEAFLSALETAQEAWRRGYVRFPT